MNTRQSKRWGFCEFRDPDSAHHAIRNLADYDVRGWRLQVEYSDRVSFDPSQISSSYRVPSASAGSTDHYGPESNAENHRMLFQVVSAIRELANKNKTDARNILVANPTLTQSLVKAIQILELGTADTSNANAPSAARLAPPSYPAPVASNPQPQLHDIIRQVGRTFDSYIWLSHSHSSSR